MIKNEGKDPAERKNGRVDIASHRKTRHVIRFGPDLADIIVIEGDVADQDATKAWKDKHGPQSSETYDAWAKPEL